MAEQQNNDATLTGNVLFYKSPEPLNPDVHGSMGISAIPSPHSFVAETNVVPLTVSEFPAASLSYPIVFIGENFMPVAAMGLSAGQNVFVSADGIFKSDSYLPAFARRYPFVFANDESQERMILCVDTGAPMVKTSNPDVPFFENGKATPYVENAMQFCSDFETERRRTESFVSLLRELNLLAPRETLYRPQNADGTPGEPQKIAEYFAVDDKVLNELSPEKLAELRDNGALTHVYAHLNSLLAWDKLIALTIERNQNPVAVN
ncbi:SapC family protein [Asticcacaulis sp. AC402]|uniref:SapC family protein n=1 Tax=Asticcacaulis sp. AC402 TaxID=1282361 RepID=UPI0003C3DE9A|nr:SapC family protein [Asticcacaulis sp. AC402]ESQ73755.1 peptidase [Asticcacaulis sp. AC402]